MAESPLCSPDCMQRKHLARRDVRWDAVLEFWLLAAGAKSVGEAFDRVAALERYARPVTGGVFVVVGIYLSLVHIYLVQV